MVVVEPFFRMGEVEVILRIGVPRQVEHQLQVIELHRIFGHRRVHPFEFGQLFEKQLLHLRLPTLLRGAFMQVVQILVGRIAAQLVLDRADLLLQEILALLLVDVLLHLTLDFVFQLGNLLLAHQYLQQPARTRQQARSLQQTLAVGVGQIHVRTDEVDRPAFVIDILDRKSRLFGHLRRNIDNIQRDVLDRIDQRLELDVRRLGNRILQRSDRSPEIRLRHDEIADFDLVQSVQDNGQIAVRHFEHFQDAGRRSDTVQIARAGLFDLRLLLQHGAEDTSAALHLANQFHRLVAADRNRRDRPREKHRTAQRQNRQHLRNHYVFSHITIFARHDRDYMVTAFEHI